MVKNILSITVLFLNWACAQAGDLQNIPADLDMKRANIERSGEITIKPEALMLAKSVVEDIVFGLTPDEILGKVNVIALELSEVNLCGTEAIQAMVDVGIPFEMAFDAIVKACNLEGPALAELNRSLSPGLAGAGGTAGGYTGFEVSP